MLMAQDNATRDLGTGAFSQVGFDPRGKNLVVTDRADNEILVFSVNRRGLPSMTPVTSMSNGIAPFSFIFDALGNLLGENETQTSCASCDKVNSLVSPR